MNMGKPALTLLVENFDELHSSVVRLKKLKIHAVYPGNGLPFPMKLFIKNH
jgi:hypothetical protein